MTTSLQRLFLRPGARFGLLAAVLLPVLYVLDASAALVNALGLDRAFATTIVNILISQGPDVLSGLFPWLRPFVSVLQWLLNFGAEFAISF